jgi:hypothetical protein
MSARDEVDLFPWILGALLMGAAIPAVIALKGNALPSPAVANAPASSRPISVQEPVQPAPRPETVEPIRQAPPAPTGQVWQCVVNGQKVFSDSRCGADASVRQLSEINRMPATPVSRTPAYPGYPMYPSAAYSTDYPDQDAPAESSASGPFIVINERGRREDGRRTHPPEHRSGQSRGGLNAR